MKPANPFPWRTALKIAWREARLSSARFGFVILAVAVGVGSLAGVRGFSREFRHMLLSQARTLMAADMSVRIFGMPTPRADGRARRARKTRRAPDVDHRNVHHGVVRRSSRAAAGFAEGRGPEGLSFLRHGQAGSRGRAAARRSMRSRWRSRRTCCCGSERTWERASASAARSFASPARWPPSRTA